MTATTSVRFCDTTLRDGQRAVAACVDDALDIALALDTIGVKHIEAGTPAAGAHGRQAVAANQQLNPKAAGFARCRGDDVAAGRGAGRRTFTSPHRSRTGTSDSLGASTGHRRCPGPSRRWRTPLTRAPP